MPNFPKRSELHHQGRFKPVSADNVPEAQPVLSDLPTPRHHTQDASAPAVNADRIEAATPPSAPQGAPMPPAANAAAPLPQASATTTHGQLASAPATSAASDTLARVQAAEPTPAAAPSTPLPTEDPETTGIRSRRLEQERQRAKRRHRARRLRAFVIIAVVLALLAGATYMAWTVLGGGSSSVLSSDDYKGTGETPVSVTVYEGALGTDIAETLVQNDVVKSVDAFIRAFNANKASASIRPGTYSLKTKMSASEAIAALLDPANRTENTVTVNPGQTVQQVIAKMKEVTEFDSAAIDAALANTAELGLPAAAGGKLEGWLAPGSYELASDETPATLLKEMVDARIAELKKLNVPEDAWQPLLIKASILEREVNVQEYLPKVARVIENRLANPAGETVGRLQMDSTVLYGVGKTGGIPTAEDLASDTPYNTYKIQGLPAGPISNPDFSALEAMAAPADGTWLYFVTIDLDTGETRFASTAAEHEQNKALLDQYCATHQDTCFK